VRFEREREALLRLPEIRFDPRLPESRRVLTDCTVSFLGARYSVPYLHVGSKVVVKQDPLGDAIEIFAGPEPIAEHRRVEKGERSIREEHVADLRRPRFERVRERAERTSRSQSRAAEVIALVAWPGVEVARRPIEEYAKAVGGAR
jgi:hypothetical protein